MSIEALSWAWRVPNLSAGCKLVLLALADHADHHGICWPGMSGLASKTGLSRRTVIRAIDTLQTQGLVAVTRRGGDGAGSHSNLYRLQMQSDIVSPPGDIVSGQSDIVSPKPSINRHITVNQPAAVGGGRPRASRARGPKGRSVDASDLGLRWSAGLERLLSESRAAAIMLHEGINDPGVARRVVAEWSATMTRRPDGDPAAALVWCCRAAMRGALAHTASGDARLPAWP